MIIWLQGAGVVCPPGQILTLPKLTAHALNLHYPAVVGIRDQDIPGCIHRHTVWTHSVRWPALWSGSCLLAGTSTTRLL